MNRTPLMANLAIPLKDLFRYWWNNVVDQEAVIDMMMDDVFTEYKDRLLPRKEPEPVVTSDTF